MQEAEDAKATFHDEYGDHLTLLNVYSSWRNQVWSLTQVFSVDFSKSRIGVKKSAFSTKTHNLGLRQLF